MPGSTTRTAPFWIARGIGKPHGPTSLGIESSNERAQMRKEQKVLREKDLDRIRKALDPNNKPRVEMILGEDSKLSTIRISSPTSEFKVDIKLAQYPNGDLSISLKPTPLGRIDQLRFARSLPTSPDGSFIFRASTKKEPPKNYIPEAHCQSCNAELPDYEYVRNYAPNLREFRFCQDCANKG